MTLGISFREALRSAAVTMLRDYAIEFGLKLQVYPGRPRTIVTPTAFVDRISESILYLGPTSKQRTPTLQIVVLHGQFDSADSAQQADQFVDTFLDWVTERYHAAGANTLVAVTATEDDPTYVPDWQPPDVQRTYFATVLTLEGFAGD